MKNRMFIKGLSLMIAVALAGCSSPTTNASTEKPQAEIVEQVETEVDTLSAAEKTAEEEAKQKVEEEAKQKVEEEVKQKAEEEAKQKAEEEAKQKAEEEAKQKAEEEAKQKAEEEARQKAEEEARKKAEEEARQKAEEEAKKEADRKAMQLKTNSISMLNYLTVIAESAEQSKSKMFLEEASHSLLNDLYPNAIDQKTQTHIANMVRNIDSLRMVAVKREHLEFIYEQNKAKAMKDAMPSPISILNVVNSTNPLKALAAVTYLAVDSYSSYTSANAAVELEYLKDNWELDADADSTISENRIEAFNYMQNIIRENGIDGDLALNADAVKEFVKWKNNTNVPRRIEFLERNESVYSAFGGYWLLLSKSYYENNNYKECLAAIDTYIETQPRIFRKDIELAETLPYVIACLGDVYRGNKLVDKEIYYTDKLCSNVGNSDWELNYFAAVSYMDIYSKTKDKSYLQKAYSIAKKNVNELNLIEEQLKLNSKYLDAIKEQEIPKNATKKEKKELENYNKMLKEIRKKELPPVDNALLMNIQLLFSIADELHIDQNEKNKIDKILHENGSQLFLVEPINSQFSYGKKIETSVNVALDANILSIPVPYVCDSSKIVVTVNHNGNLVKYDDWKLKEVKRPKDKVLEEYIASYTSESMKKGTVEAGDVAMLELYPYGDEVAPIKLEFKAKENKILLYSKYNWELIK